MINNKKKEVKKIRLKGSFTVEASVLVPLLTIITLALISTGFYVRNSVILRALAWREAIKIEMPKTDRAEKKEDIMNAANLRLSEAIQDQGMYLKNIRTSAIQEANGNIKVDIRAQNALNIVTFTPGSFINVTQTAEGSNPPETLRKWHALGIVKENVIK